jgi:ComF family protein
MLNLRKFGKVLLPYHCLLCDETNSETAICQHCLADLPWHPTNSCMQCGLVANSLICGHCLKQPPYYDRTHAVFNYIYPVDALLQHYKYRHALHLSQAMGELLSEKLIGKNLDTLIAMPLHPNRILDRGFNQSLEIAKIAAKISAIPLDIVSCHRVKDTPPQASLALKARISNIKGAFICTGDFRGKRIAIIDDVMTSGASLNELAKTIKGAGASEVHCFVIARTQ